MHVLMCFKIAQNVVPEQFACVEVFHIVIYHKNWPVDQMKKEM